MKEQLTELINTIYEAEGLLDMALRRNAQPGDRVLYLALAKCHEISRKASEIDVNLSAVSPQNEEAQSSQALYQPEIATEPVAAQEPEDVLSNSPTMPIESPTEIEKEVEVFTNEVLPLQEQSIDTIPDIADASIFDTETQVDTAPTSEVQSNVNRPPLIRAFSINDKYRYRTSLFGGSDMQMRDTLAEFEVMSNMDEALDYCEHTLGWDMEDEDVKGFLTILENYYRTHEE